MSNTEAIQIAGKVVRDPEYKNAPDMPEVGALIRNHANRPCSYNFVMDVLRTIRAHEKGEAVVKPMTVQDLIDALRQWPSDATVLVANPTSLVGGEGDDADNTAKPLVNVAITTANSPFEATTLRLDMQH